MHSTIDNRGMFDAIETKEQAGEGLGAPPCSPASETPRTDKAMADLNWHCRPLTLHLQIIEKHAQILERELAAAHRALMICYGAMMGKVNPKSEAFKRVNAILRPENAELTHPEPKL
jgi:hypothetical protein